MLLSLLFYLFIFYFAWLSISLFVYLSIFLFDFPSLRSCRQLVLDFVLYSTFINVWIINLCGPDHPKTRNTTNGKIRHYHKAQIKIRAENKVGNLEARRRTNVLFSLKKSHGTSVNISKTTTFSWDRINFGDEYDLI